MWGDRTTKFGVAKGVTRLRSLSMILLFVATKTFKDQTYDAELDTVYSLGFWDPGTKVLTIISDAELITDIPGC